MRNVAGLVDARAYRRRTLWRAGLLAAALAVGATSTAAHADSPEVWEYKVTPAQKAEAAAVGEKDGAKAGGPYAIPKGKKIGLILLSGQSASSKRIELPVEKLAKLFGYDVAVRSEFRRAEGHAMRDLAGRAERQRGVHHQHQPRSDGLGAQRCERARNSLHRDRQRSREDPASDRLRQPRSSQARSFPQSGCSRRRRSARAPTPS